MYSGADSCSSYGGCEKRDKYTDSCRGCNQSIKTPFTRECTVYTGLGKFLNGRIVSLYNPFTRNRAQYCYNTACTSPYKFCQSQLWNGFLIKGTELGSTLLTRKLCKNFHGRTNRTGQNFWPTADQVKNLHGSEGPGCVYEMRIRARFCPFNNLSGPVKLYVRFWKKRKCLYQHF